MKKRVLRCLPFGFAKQFRSSPDLEVIVYYTHHYQIDIEKKRKIQYHVDEIYKGEPEGRFFLYLLAGFEPGAYLNSGSADKSKTEPLRRSPYT